MLFGEAAARLCSAASLLLRWRPEEFWNATPAELALAITFAGDEAEGPDAKTIEALRQRFPDQVRAEDAERAETVLSASVSAFAA
jgi:uncharacterized phage protein (TIGR02216 family)